MKKLSFVGFCLALVMGVGCAITDYETITDNAQFVNEFFGPKSKVPAPEPGYTVDTNGNALIRPSSQVATIWPDGTDEWITFVDQAANADRALNTYNNFATPDQATFHDDLFCNPDWAGCAVWMANDSGTCDTAGGGCFANFQFDGVGDANCLGFRSLSLLAATSRYLGECGAALFGGKDDDDGDGDAHNNPSVADTIAALNMSRVGDLGGLAGIWLDYDHNSLTINVNGNLLPVASGSVFSNMPRRLAIAFLDNPMNERTLRAFDDAVALGQIVELSVGYNGIYMQRAFKKMQHGSQLAFAHY